MRKHNAILFVLTLSFVMLAASSCKTKEKEFLSLHIPDFEPFQYVQYDDNVPYAKVLDLALTEVKKQQGLFCINMSLAVYDGTKVMDDCVAWYSKVMKDQEVMNQCEKISSDFGEEVRKSLFGCNYSAEIVRAYCEEVFGYLNKESKEFEVLFSCRKNGARSDYYVNVNATSLAVVSSGFVLNKK